MIKGLLALAVIFTTLNPAQAQCPAGSASNVAGSYTNGQTVCISANVSGSITLHNGATMYVVTGGNFTGDIDAKSGSSIIVNGGTFNPNNANNFAAAVTVRQNGTARLGTGNISFSSGFSLNNTGSLTMVKSFSTGSTMTLTNTACGTMTFSQSVSLSNNSSLINQGTVIMQNTLTTSSGTTIDNRGTVTVSGNTSLSGLYRNQWKTVFKGGSNTFNSGDSIINLYTMTLTSTTIGAPKLRNNGLFWIKGSFTYNSGGNANIVGSNSLFRVDGAMMNNSTITGYGNKLYVGGSFVNNGTLRGNNSTTQRLTINQTPVNNAPTNTDVSSFTPQDTTSYTGGFGNPSTCNALLPMTVTALKGNITDNGILLSWATVAELNGKKFVVEYSTDGIAYAVAGEVAAKGNSNSRLEYNYLFTKNTGNTVYFRLNMVDIDGRSEYSNTVMVKAGSTQTMTVGVFPNPFTEKLDVTLRISRSTPVAIKIFDMNGRTAKSQLFNGQSGNNKFTLTGLSALQPGLYLVEVTAGEEKWMQKVIR